MLSGVRLFELAARTAFAGRANRDPVLILAAKALADRIALREVGPVRVTAFAARPLVAASAAALFDARPIALSLDAEANRVSEDMNNPDPRSRANERPLLDEIRARLPHDRQPSRACTYWTATVEPGRGLAVPLAAGREIAVAGDGAAPLDIVLAHGRETVAECQAFPTCGWALNDLGTGTLRLQIANPGLQASRIMVVSNG